MGADCCAGGGGAGAGSGAAGWQVGSDGVSYGRRPEQAGPAQLRALDGILGVLHRL